MRSERVEFSGSPGQMGNSLGEEAVSEPASESSETPVVRP